MRPLDDIRVIGLDADDTLWHSENRFHHAHEEYRQLLSRYVDIDADELDDRMLATERRNLSLFGYGVKGFVLSLIETSIELTDGAVDATGIQQIIDLGKDLLTHPVELLDGVAETITELLDRNYELALITKGDLLHQESKIAASGLADVMSSIDIVSEKSPEVYAGIVRRHGVTPERFCMIGNSLRSDVAPSLEIGGAAVHIPYEYVWAHEVVDTPESHPRFRVLDRFGELPVVLPG